MRIKMLRAALITLSGNKELPMTPPPGTPQLATSDQPNAMCIGRAERVLVGPAFPAQALVTEISNSLSVANAAIPNKARQGESNGSALSHYLIGIGSRPVNLSARKPDRSPVREDEKTTH